MHSKKAMNCVSVTPNAFKTFDVLRSTQMHLKKAMNCVCQWLRMCLRPLKYFEGPKHIWWMVVDWVAAPPSFSSQKWSIRHWMCLGPSKYFKGLKHIQFLILACGTCPPSPSFTWIFLGSWWHQSAGKTTSRCFDLAYSDLARLSPNHVTLLKSPQNTKMPISQQPQVQFTCSFFPWKLRSRAFISAIEHTSVFEGV